MIVSAFAVKLSSPGPPFFRQKRIGRGGKFFTLYKLRTMHTENNGVQLTSPKDSRIFPLGHILRRTKLDEFPQLFNVLAGEMSFVGPRPEIPAFVQHYKPQWRLILDITPGITSIGSLIFKNEENLKSEEKARETWYINEILPQKIELEMEYTKHSSLALDLYLILVTIASLLFGSSVLKRENFIRLLNRKR